jgi:hypothetical protein
VHPTYRLVAGVWGERCCCWRCEPCVRSGSRRRC